MTELVGKGIARLPSEIQDMILFEVASLADSDKRLLELSGISWRVLIVLCPIVFSNFHIWHGSEIIKFANIKERVKKRKASSMNTDTAPGDSSEKKAV